MDFGAVNEISSSLSSFLENYGLWAVFIGTLFTGEVAILLSISFALSGFFSFTEVIVVTTLATFCADFFWFLVGGFFAKYFLRIPMLQRLLIFSDSKDRESVIRTAPYVLLISRFAYGLRLVLTLWLAIIGVTIRRFTIMNTLGTFIYIIILCLFAVASHQGLQAIAIVQNPLISFCVALLVTVLISITIRHHLGFIKQVEKVKIPPQKK